MLVTPDGRYAYVANYTANMVSVIDTSTYLVRNIATTTRFVENQLAYDQRQLKAAQDRAEAARQALAVYAGDQRTLSGGSAEGGQIFEG